MRRFTLLTITFLLASASAPVARAQAPIRPGDRLIVVLADTVDTLPLRADGHVVLPRLGPLHVAGLAPSVAEDSVSRAYTRIFARRDVRITALRRVVVTGEVPRGDVFFVDATVGLAEAIALAGGVGPEGNRRRIELWRGGAMVARVRSTSGAALQQPLESGDIVLVARENWWLRNPFVIVSLLSSAVSLFIALSL
ncbi:polysaccharide biosynthesis/export family protein [Pseudogemmatithrix spongiicola]|uniref:Polysaccharide biosynthesis/export family protein n=1 Tax=Pseudogemmatithrix spongiicola TaxID=3062599 RepID=A0AA49JVM2_9BACT|nr:polysaccharide biosynthesis/export family protein [Gemmatimonadaceae bacterium 'strain 138']WKW15360.1 polysaccharide biosynthesis/export family protein [Gemmatimonadaceae bacterium 'strain 318']